ncbi:MAG: hypothetical protein JWR19_2597 [Pedosphaera sp.]|nr:hypothetical protein [Pedosphaera sp.]
MSRIGKIARLPLAVRFKLNCRLENGESHRAVLRWLNELPEVKEMLAREFDGKRINDPNLTAWSQGGFAEWQLRRELVGEAQQADESVTEFREERKERCGKRTESALQNLGLSLGFRYAGVIAEYDRDPLSESLVKKVKVLRAVTHGVVALQLSEVRSGQLQLNIDKFGVRSSECGIGEQKNDTPAGAGTQVLPHGSMGETQKKEDEEKMDSHADRPLPKVSGYAGEASAFAKGSAYAQGFGATRRREKQPMGEGAKKGIDDPASPRLQRTGEDEDERSPAGCFRTGHRGERNWGTLSTNSERRTQNSEHCIPHCLPLPLKIPFPPYWPCASTSNFSSPNSHLRLCSTD